MCIDCIDLVIGIVFGFIFVFGDGIDLGMVWVEGSLWVG